MSTRRNAIGVCVPVAEQLPDDAYPNMARMVASVAERPEDFPLRFDFGLDHLLEGLERLRPRE